MIFIKCTQILDSFSKWFSAPMRTIKRAYCLTITKHHFKRKISSGLSDHMGRFLNTACAVEDLD